MPHRHLFSAAVLATLSLPLSALAQIERVVEEPDSGGTIQMVVPETWQPGDALVIYDHGFDFDADAPEKVPEVAASEEFEAYLLEQGYALAAHSYSHRGWALFDAREDHLALYRAFEQRFGAPGAILVTGGSLGGIMSVRGAEHLVDAGLPVTGVLSLCPPLAGARTWDFAADLKLAYDAVCEGVGGGEIDRGSSEPDWILGLDQLPADWSDFGDPAVQHVAARITQCTGVTLPPALRSSGQKERLQRLKEEFGVTDDDFLVLNMSYAAFALADLVRADDKLEGRSPFDNRFVVYDDPDVDADIERVTYDPLARLDLRAATDPMGNFAHTKLLVVHTTRDELVIPEHVSSLRERIVPDDEWTRGAGLFAQSRTSTAMVAEDAPNHCEFSGSELLAAFEALRDWAGGGTQPDAASLQVDCETINAQERADGGRCAFDADAEPGDFAARVKPRLLEEYDAIVDRTSGAWYDPATDGEGLVIHTVPDRHEVVVSWYTYAPDGSGEQAWIIGNARVIDSGLVVDDAFVYRGGGFGEAFDASTLQRERWGRLTMLVEGYQQSPPQPGDAGLRTARLRYEGPEGWGTGERSLVQITHNGCAIGECTSLDDAPGAMQGYTGLWYRGDANAGDGIFLQAPTDGAALLVWYAYTPDGEPLWLLGAADVAAFNGSPDGGSMTFTVQRPRGATFGDAFDPDDVERVDWGTVTLAFDGCDAATMSWDSVQPGFDDGAIALQRLTRAPRVPACEPTATVAGGAASR